MSLLRLRCSCKKIIVENETKYTFVFDDYNRHDMNKILDRELFMFKNHIEHMHNPGIITQIKSFANSQTFSKNEMYKQFLPTRQVFTLVTTLNDLTVKSNINIARFVDTVNKFGKYNVNLYVKLHKNTQPCTLISTIEVCGVEVTKSVEIPNQTTKIIGMIKRSRQNDDNMI